MSYPWIEIKQVEYIGELALKIQFNDGKTQVVHFKLFISNSAHPDIQKYLDELRFQEFQILHGDLVWNDFEMCFPVADSYENKNIKLPQITTA